VPHKEIFKPNWWIQYKSDIIFLPCSSFMELVNADVETDHIHVLTDSMFSQPGLEDKTELTFEDFKNCMGEYMTNLDDAKLNMSGKLLYNTAILMRKYLF
jgi:hypothetical protein